MRLFPFRGVRYSGEEAGSLAAPPYDQINGQDRDRFHAASPHHFAQITRPVAAEGGDPHQHAAALHEAWLREEVIELDTEPSLYPYEIRLAGGGSRLGVFALIGLEGPQDGIIRPHEQTIDKTVDERLGLLRTTRCDLGPVLLLSEDEGELNRLLGEDVGRGEPLAAHEDDLGHRHLLFRVSAPERLALYREALSQAAGLIADGHHRYKTARLYASEIGATEGDAAATKLCVVTSLASPALTIDPIHRALRDPLDPEREFAGVVARKRLDAVGGSAIAAAIAVATQPAVAVASSGWTEIWHLDAASGPDDLPRAASLLSVVLLHRTLFPQLDLPPTSATDGTVLYRSDPEDLYRMIQSGEAGVGFWLPSMTPGRFSATIAEGDLLPPKSTRFMPKVISGLVWAAHDTTVPGVRDDR